jgi:hypothetical protein
VVGGNRRSVIETPLIGMVFGVKIASVAGNWGDFISSGVCFADYYHQEGQDKKTKKMAMKQETVAGEGKDRR